MGDIVAIIQARMASSRFPGKVMAAIAGRPMLWHIVQRLRHANTLDRIVVATSDQKSDDPIVELSKHMGVSYYRGCEFDVLDRYYEAAKSYGAEVVVRITADCPLIDPQVVDKVVSTYLDGGYDYVANTLRITYPAGLDTEVFSFAALEKAWKGARKDFDREHVTTYIRLSGKFRIKGVENEEASRFYYRWTVDEPRDLEFIRRVYSKFVSDKGLLHNEDIRVLLCQSDVLDNRTELRDER
ncbi:MAG: cytidylyltransferase domain-containing protein [Candidatus Hodarchaeota archaeon]